MSAASERHNHITRDIKPRGECPACDAYYDRHGSPVSAASEREALVQIMRDRDDMFVTFEMHADAILAAGFTRQSRAEIQAEAVEFLDWLIRMGDVNDAQGREDRCTVTLTQIIERARRVREGADRG